MPAPEFPKPRQAEMLAGEMAQGSGGVMRKPKLRAMAVALALGCVLGLAGCSKKAENPKAPNNVMARLITQVLQAEIGAVEAKSAPDSQDHFIPAAAENTREWIAEVDQVVARCRNGKEGKGRFNSIVYDVKLKEGRVIDNVYSSARCGLNGIQPLEMWVSFRGDKVTVELDEKDKSVSAGINHKDAVNLVKTLLKIDRTLRPNRYYAPGVATSGEVKKNP